MYDIENVWMYGSFISPFAHTGSYPSPKAGATLVMYKDLLVLFGGWTRPSPYPLHQPERFFDEIHTYSPSKNWWEEEANLDSVDELAFLKPMSGFITLSTIHSLNTGG